MAQGIPVTIFDSGIDTENYVSFVATDNVGAGRLAAKTVSSLLPDGGPVAMVRHAPGSLSTSRREEGFQAALADTYQSLEIVNEQYCMSDRARALAVSEDMLTAHPELKALFCSSEAATVGAAQAIKARGLAGKVRLVGFDASPSLQDGLREGAIDALIVQDPFFMGYRGVETVLESLRGETPDKRIDSPARAVFQADLDTPEVQRLLNPDLESYL
jgi:ribose transport system substrate-binding protein